MIRILIFLITLFFFGGTQAQPAGKANITHDFSLLQKLQEHIELSDQQILAIKTVLIHQSTKIAELKSQLNGDDINDEETKKAINRIRSDSDSAIVNLLSAEQIFRFQRRGKSAAMKTKFQTMRFELDKFISKKDKNKIEDLRSIFKTAYKQKKILLEKNKLNEAVVEKDSIYKILENTYKSAWKTLNRLVKKYNLNIETIFKKNNISSLPKRRLKKSFNCQQCLGKSSGDLCCRDVAIKNYFKDEDNETCLFYPSCIYKSKPHFLLLELSFEENDLNEMKEN